MKKLIRKIFHFTKFFIVSILLIRTFIISPGVINGRSMEPTFYDQDTFFLNKFIYLIRKPKRGEIIQLQEPDQTKIMIKRIIGIEGDRISISKKGVFIQTQNGDVYKLHEPYLKPLTRTLNPEGKLESFIEIPKNHFFVMGDNRSMSADSRAHGFFHRNRIYGLVITSPFSNR